MQITEADPDARKRGPVQTELANSAPARRVKRPRCALLCGLLCLSLGILLSSACDGGSATPALPPGNWIYGDARVVSELLESLETLRGTPTARSAARLREKLAGCDEFLAHSSDAEPQSFLEQVQCVTATSLPTLVPASVVALRAEGDLAIVIEIRPGRQLSGRLVRTPTGAVSLVASIETPTELNLAGLLIPAEDPAGAAVLAAAETLVHARLRPASGLNVAAMVSEDSQADQMFRLRSELFLGQVLDGTWEIAIYMPREGRLTPPVALALDFSLRPAAKVAMERFVSELEATWPIHHTDYVYHLPAHLPAHLSADAGAKVEGACFHDLRLLPDLTPCYVLTERSIVLGWNPMSIELALAPTPETPPFGDSGGLVVHLDRLPEADRRLQQQLGTGEGTEKFNYVWDQLRVDADNDGDRLELRVRLESGGAS